MGILIDFYKTFIFLACFFLSSVLALKNISKSYADAGKERIIFENLNLEINKGESVLLLGNSGCGKSTLLQIAGLLQGCDGEVFIDGECCDIRKMKDRKKNKILSSKVGFIYQFHYLFSDFSVMENLVIPQMVNGVGKKKAEKNASEILEKMKIIHRKDAMPDELSGGEKQRVAIARAIVKKPILILADEPTGNLDNDMSELVVDEMLNMVKNDKIALLMVSHNRGFISKFDKAFELGLEGLARLK